MSGCHNPTSTKRPDCIACNGGVWMGIYPPECICNSDKRTNMSAIYYDENKENVSPLIATIQECHKKIKEFKDELDKLKSRDDQLLEIIKSTFAAQQSRPYKKEIPHKCPVCDGLGKINNTTITTNSYSICSSTSEKNCSACNAKGIIWG